MRADPTPLSSPPFSTTTRVESPRSRLQRASSGILCLRIISSPSGNSRRSLAVWVNARSTRIRTWIRSVLCFYDSFDTDIYSLFYLTSRLIHFHLFLFVSSSLFPIVYTQKKSTYILDLEFYPLMNSTNVRETRRSHGWISWGTSFPTVN